MPYITLGCRTLFLASLCLTVFAGNSAKATLLPSEHLGVSLTSDNPAHSFEQPDFLFRDNFLFWNSARNSNPGMKFDLLGSSNFDGVPLDGNVEAEGSTLSQFRLSESLLRFEQSPAKATCQASQLLASDIAVITKIKSPVLTVNSLGLNGRPRRRPVSGITSAASATYGVLAVLALGGICITVFRWHERRQQYLAFESNPDSDLLKMAMPGDVHPGLWTTGGSLDSSPTRSNQPASQTK